LHRPIETALVYQEEFGLTQDIAGAEKSYFSVMLMRT